MDQVTQQNAALVEQAAAAAASMQDQAASLAEAVSVFKTAHAHAAGEQADSAGLSAAHCRQGSAHASCNAGQGRRR